MVVAVVAVIGGMNRGGDKNCGSETQTSATTQSGGFTMPGGMGMPGGFTMPQNGEMPGGMSMPNDFTKPQSSEAPAAIEAPAQEKTGGNRSFERTERSRSSRFSGSFGTAETVANTQEQGILLAVCAIVLLAAIIVAAVFKRNV